MTHSPWRGVVLPAAACVPLEAAFGAALIRSGSPVAVPFLALAAIAIAGLIGVRFDARLVVVVGAASLACLLLVPDGPPVAVLPLAAALVNAVARGAERWAVGTAGAAVLLPIAELLLTRSPVPALRAVAECLVLAAAVGIGFAARARLRRQEEEERAAAAQVAAQQEQERMRIARELHDVLAHSLSAISVQAGVGLHLAATRPDAAREALEHIRAASTSALGEVRSMIGSLRGDEQAPRAPEPDLDGVAGLVAHAAALGLDASLDDRLQPRPAAGVQLAVHRIVQESLTNAARHAGGRRVRVTLERGGGAVLARVRDEGGRVPVLPDAPSGRGLVGMRERAALAGGSFELVPHADGLEVVVRIPEARS